MPTWRVGPRIYILYSLVGRPIRTSELRLKHEMNSRYQNCAVVYSALEGNRTEHVHMGRTTKNPERVKPRILTGHLSHCAFSVFKKRT